MLSHILRKVKKVFGLSMDSQHTMPSDASCEVQHAHTFEENIDNEGNADHLTTSSQNYNPRNVMWNYLRAALRGDKNAQYEIGLCYLNGHLGLDRSYQHAEKWLSQAARQGHSEAQQALEKVLNHINIS